MKKYFVTKLLVLLVMMFLLVPSVSLALESIGSGPMGESMVGERLDGSAIGVGYVESMDVAIARDHIRQLSINADSHEEGRHHGIWKVPSRGASYYPYSGEHYVLNKWGNTLMGISFPSVVDVHGAWFTGQGGSEILWTSGVRVMGYRDGVRTETTGWFRDVDAVPSWFAMDLVDVDRIVVESIPVYNSGGWYAVDDLTYTPKASGGSDVVVVDFEDAYYHQVLSGSEYAGLTWETGMGEVYDDMADRLAFIPDDSEVSVEEMSRGLDGTPALIHDFQGVIRGDATSWSYPPDSCGAVGPDHFVNVVNRNFAVYDKDTGDELINILLGDFLPGSNGDPRVLYDQYSDRWFVIVCDFTSRIYLAVSRSDDPTGDWFKCDFMVSQGSDAGKWPDYPTLGVDVDGLYTSAYMIGGGGTMSIFALEKAPLIASNPGLGAIYAFRGLPYEGAVQPVHSFGSCAGEYFVSRMSSTGLRVRLLTGMLGTPVLSEVCVASVPSHSAPPDAPAMGSSVPLDTVGHRLMNAVYRDGFIWTAHCISVGGRAASRWYKIDVPGLSLADYGTISDSVLYYYFPTIMVNAGGDVVMGFSGSCSNQYAAAYYTGRLASDPAGYMADPVLLKGGEATYNLVDGYGRNRWGDYSLCSLDPVSQTFWTIQEYAHSHNGTGENRWGTWIGELAFNLPPDIPGPVDGPVDGVVGMDYSFSGVTTDPEGDSISYMFEWGDGNSSDWIGPVASGVSVSGSYRWMNAGVFDVRVKASDGTSESGWSVPKQVEIVLGPILEVRPLSSGLFRLEVPIKNSGDVDASDVSWRIELSGGAVIGGSHEGTGFMIPAGGTAMVTSGFIFGFGPTEVLVTVEYGDGGVSSRRQDGFVFLFFINIVSGGG